MSDNTQLTAQHYANVRRTVQRNTATDLIQQPDGAYSPVTIIEQAPPRSGHAPAVSRAVGSLVGRAVYVVGSVAVGLVMLCFQLPYWVVATMIERRRERVRFVDGSRSERIASVRSQIVNVQVNVNQS
jgi:hypothetical protein